ncbi:MAG: CC0125/CC1285 family lipoprotein [Oceanicaulis sp.]
MTRFFLYAPAVLFLGLAACAPTPTAYGPAAAAPSGIGYEELRIEQDRWRVSFTGGPSASRSEVERLALRRAAELTLANGYDWFTVVDRRFDQEGENRSPVRVGGSVGGAVGSGGFRGSGVGVGISLSPGQERRFIVSLEIIAGSGPQPAGAYDAAFLAGPDV